MLKALPATKPQIVPTPQSKSFPLYFPSSSQEPVQCGSLSLSPKGSARIDLPEILVNAVPTANPQASALNIFECPLIHPRFGRDSQSLKDFIGSHLVPQLHILLQDEQKPTKLSVRIGKRAEVEVATPEMWSVQPSELRSFSSSDYATYALVKSNRTGRRSVRFGQKPTIYDHIDYLANEDSHGGGYLFIEAGTLYLRHMGGAFYDPEFGLVCKAALAIAALAKGDHKIAKIIVDGEIELDLKVPKSL